MSKIWLENKLHHKLVGVIFHYSPSFPRALRVLSLSTNVIPMLFIQSLTYSVTQEDSTACTRLTSIADCLQPKSAFDSSENKSFWTGSDCVYIHPSDRTKVVIFVAIFSALVSTPIALCCQWWLPPPRSVRLLTLRATWPMSQRSLPRWPHS